MRKITRTKPYKVGGGSYVRFSSMKLATDFCSKVFSNTNLVLSIEEDMGYSCTTRASHMLGVICHLWGHGDSSNTIKLNNQLYFYEIGDENHDGSITGKLVTMHEGNLGSDAGNFRIAATGEIVDFPELTKHHKEEAWNLLNNTNPHKLNEWALGRI